ncbi:hypothetical protein MIR68_009834 [Amoeboaphelidium protococcarum]|nr:hypothetical protein MIR68_009834 [Amoeboaphelidium protococcarum]
MKQNQELERQILELSSADDLIQFLSKQLPEFLNSATLTSEAKWKLIQRVSDRIVDIDKYSQNEDSAVEMHPLQVPISDDLKVKTKLAISASETQSQAGSTKAFTPVKLNKNKQAELGSEYAISPVRRSIRQLDKLTMIDDPCNNVQLVSSVKDLLKEYNYTFSENKALNFEQ